MKLKLFLSKDGKPVLSLENTQSLIGDLYSWHEALEGEILSTYIDVCIADSNDILWWGYRGRNGFTLLKVVIKMKDGSEIKAYKVIDNCSHIKPPLGWFKDIPNEPKKESNQKGKPLPELLTEQLKEYFQNKAESSAYYSEKYASIAKTF